MQKIKEIVFYHRKQIIFVASLLLCLIGIFFLSIINNKYNAEVVFENNNQIEKTVISEEEKMTEEIVLIRVDVKGAVNNPGVYELALGSRVIDAINLAGGLREDAFTRYLNLSKKLNDEYVVLVNTASEIETIKTQNKFVEQEEAICERVTNACLEHDKVITNTENSKSDISSSEKTIKNDNEQSLININTATIEELTTLDGIGESKAKAIIDYRLKNGLFVKIDDIQNVSGIGDKAYEKIKESITVE